MMAVTSAPTPGLLTAGVVSAAATVSAADVCAVAAGAGAGRCALVLSAGVAVTPVLSTTLAVAVAISVWNPPRKEACSVGTGAAEAGTTEETVPPKISAKLYCAPAFGDVCALAVWFRSEERR